MGCEWGLIYNQIPQVSGQSHKSAEVHLTLKKFIDLQLSLQSFQFVLFASFQHSNNKLAFFCSFTWDFMSFPMTTLIVPVNQCAITKIKLHVYKWLWKGYICNNNPVSVCHCPVCDLGPQTGQARQKVLRQERTHCWFLWDFFR